MRDDGTQMTSGENANPYAAPKAAMVDELPVRVTMRMRWLFIVMFSISGLYQLMGCAWAFWSGYLSGAMAGTGRTVDRILWLFFLIGGVMALYVVWCLLRRRWSRRVFWMGLVVAFLTWVPFVILNVVPVMLWILHRPRRGDDEVMSRPAKERVEMPAEEAMRVVKTEAMIRFGIRADELGVPLVRGLRFAPGEVSDFLADLEVDHGISIGDEVDASRVSVEEMVEVLGRREGGESNR